MTDFAINGCLDLLPEGLLFLAGSTFAILSIAIHIIGG